MGKKIKIFFSLFLLIIGVVLTIPAPSVGLDTETAFKVALEKANRGENEQAIRDLEELKKTVPNDPRISLSLGLLYQSTDRNDEAIRELENSNLNSPSFQASYALGLLYESKWFKTDDASWKMKAIQAWESSLRLAPSESSHRDTINKHLQRLRNNG